MFLSPGRCRQGIPRAQTRQGHDCGSSTLHLPLSSGTRCSFLCCSISLFNATFSLSLSGSSLRRHCISFTTTLRLISSVAVVTYSCHNPGSRCFGLRVSVEEVLFHEMPFHFPLFGFSFPTTFHSFTFLELSSQ